jgi:hypothetical protein
MRCLQRKLHLRCFYDTLRCHCCQIVLKLSAKIWKNSATYQIRCVLNFSCKNNSLKLYIFSSLPVKNRRKHKQSYGFSSQFLQLYFPDSFLSIFAKFCNFTVTNFFLQWTFFGACFELFSRIFGHLAKVCVDYIPLYSSRIWTLEIQEHGSVEYTAQQSQADIFLVQNTTCFSCMNVKDNIKVFIRVLHFANSLYLAPPYSCLQRQGFIFNPAWVLFSPHKRIIYGPRNI